MFDCGCVLDMHALRADIRGKPSRHVPSNDWSGLGRVRGCRSTPRRCVHAVPKMALDLLDQPPLLLRGLCCPLHAPTRKFVCLFV
jgi:hypothetical protein